MTLLRLLLGSKAPGKKSISRRAALRTREAMVLHNGGFRASPASTPYTDLHEAAANVCSLMKLGERARERERCRERERESERVYQREKERERVY